MRMIASDCDTTTQTVFNLVGNKSDLLTAAIADYATSLGVTALNWNSYPANSLGLTDAIWESARCNPEYVREATFGFATLSQYSSRCVRAGGTSVVAASLSDIRERFRSGRHFEAVVGSITSLISSAVFDWAQGRINIAALRSQMLERVALVLVGAVDVEKGMEIDAWIGEALRD